MLSARPMSQRTRKERPSPSSSCPCLRGTTEASLQAGNTFCSDESLLAISCRSPRQSAQRSFEKVWQVKREEDG
ncbi:hypothetical protein EYF80_019618 [Liparis tanakae]|uniref:Uncharacterized protein n=1 Tax=Liparis tanakae TaxID=230148 RepID=A0A4Z2HWR6_9TELE|nr:hypothetical protein EYF80_019618 [Liparis tanakae]